jgi:phosphate starvation-inducible PhoH-like protein
MAAQRRQKSTKFQAQAEAVPPLRPLTERQGEYIGAIFGSDNVICLGPAGTGKTFVATTIAANLFRRNAISSIKLP